MSTTAVVVGLLDATLLTLPGRLLGTAVWVVGGASSVRITRRGALR